MALLSIAVLGPLVITRDAVPVEDFAYNKVRALLAYLAVEAGRSHPRDELCALLWPDQPDRAARRNLSQALTQLRRALRLGDAGAPDAPSALLRASPDAVELNRQAGWDLDSARFTGLLAESEAHAHHAWHTCAACGARLQAALALYRGDFLAGFSLPDSAPFEEWALIWRERLRQRAMSALERLADWAEWRGEVGQAAAYARRQVELDPLNEPAHRAAMRLLALNGELSAAGAQYEQLRRVLAAELAAAPEAATVALLERIRAAASAPTAHLGPLQSRARDSLRRFHPPPFNGPSPPYPLIGRAAALTAVTGLLRDGPVRLLTLTGTPGIGKTRLALQAASELRFDFADGVHFVDLAPLTGAAWVPAAIAQALGLREQAAQPLGDTLIKHLQGKHALLVLDNYEHVLEAAIQAAELLAACPALRVLATSRTPLRLRAEHTYALDPLEAAAARQLFAERVRAAGPGLLGAPTVDTVAEICRRLDHLPLAIELVAVRARVLSPADLLRQLDQPLSALTSAPRDLPERHRTLRSALAWSYDRLTPPEQLVFRRLGVFTGGATVEAAQAVTVEDPAALARLEALHEASLVQLQPAGAETRFTLLETVREFAQEQLARHGEAETARRRHLDYFLALAERASPALEGSGQAEWFDRLERDHGNLRAALGFARSLDDAAQMRLAVALGKFWEVRGHLAEGRRWLAEALERRPRAPLNLRGEALAVAGLLAYRQGDYAGARALNEQSLLIWQQLEDEPAIARVLRRIGTALYDQGDLAGARAYFEQSLDLARRNDDVPGIAGALNNLGLLAGDQGDIAQAAALHAEALPLFRQLGDQVNVGMLLINLGLATSRQMDYPAAQALIEQALALFRELGHKWGVALALLNLGNVALYQGNLALAAASFEEGLALDVALGDEGTASYLMFGLGEVAYARGEYAQARARYRESLALRQSVGERLPMPRNLEGLGQLERAAGRPERAARLFGAAQALRERLSTRPREGYAAEYDGAVAALRADLGEVAFAQAWAAGRALTLEEAIALALEN